MRERLQKLLARAGIASRRGAEELIASGRVRVDGRVVTELGTTVDGPRARIQVDGRAVRAERATYVLWHKPRGVMSTLRDPEGRSTVADYVRDVGVRIMPVGRLDYHTSGVVLLTNDGDFASTLCHPRRGVTKEYVAKVKGRVDEPALDRWRQSIVIDGRATRPAQVEVLRQEGDKTWLRITLREGRNRQVRRLGEAAGFPVMRLARVSYAGITAEGLKPGQWRLLTVDELKQLKARFGVPRRIHQPQRRPLHAKRSERTR